MQGSTHSYDARTEAVLAVFSELSRIPRPSKNESRIRTWLVKYAADRGWKNAVDAFGNLVIYIPASSGSERRPPLILQGHMDMVCEKQPESTHNFDEDPIPLVRENEWLRADGTTLGADNGIAIAMALALAADPALRHPPLEICLTTEEETGLTGAANLDSQLLGGRRLINLDSEDEGVITVGCAGGLDSDIAIPVSRSSVPADPATRCILLAGGMHGGHSGVEIGQIRANALRVLGRALQSLEGADYAIELVGVHGGNAHNAIPRDAFAIVECSTSHGEFSQLQAHLEQLQETLRREFQPVEQKLSLILQPLREAPEHLRTAAAGFSTLPVLSLESADSLRNALLAFPHGPEKFSGVIDGLVETSCNFATIRTAAEQVSVLCSQRSSQASGLDGITARIQAVTALLGGTCRSGNGYPPWEPDFSSELLQHARHLYQQRFGQAPVVETIHAGLECGIIGGKLPGMEMISIGPTIQYPHSPDERLHLPSLQSTIAFVVDLLASYA